MPRSGEYLLRISADSRYRLFIDGEFVDDGSVPSVPWYQHYDSRRIHLDAGVHTIACIVYHRGTDEESRAGLLAELEDTEGATVCATDGDWQACPAPAWNRNTYYFRMNKVAPFQERFDANHLPPDWWQSDALPWQPARVIKPLQWTFRASETQPPIAGPWTKLVQREIAFLRRRRQRPKTLLAVEECIDSPPRTHGDDLSLSLSEPGAPIQRSTVVDPERLLKGDGPCILACGMDDEDFADGRYDPCLLFDFGTVLAAHVLLDVEANGGETIEIGFAPVLRRGHFYNVLETGFSCSFTLRPGRQELRNFHARGFRYLRLRLKRADQPIKLHALQIESVEYPYAETGTFAGADAELMTLDACCRRTLACCTQETWVDSPTRESGQFTGDSAAVFVDLALACHGETAMTRQFLRMAANSSRPNGLLNNVSNAISEAAGPETTIPDFSLWWIRALWRYHEYSAAAALLRELFLSVQRIMQFNRQLPRCRGMVADVPGWLFIDWAQIERRGACGAYNGILVLACDAACRIAGAVGQPALAAEWSSFAEEIRSGMMALRRDDGLFADGFDGDGRPWPSVCEHVQALAMLLGLGSADALQELAQTLYTDGAVNGIVECQPFFTHLVLQGLTRIGRRDLALQEIRRRWGRRMLDRGANTTWEEWTIYGRWYRDRFDGGHRTPSHAWSAGPAAFFRTGLCGLRILEPGCARIAIAPYLAEFDYCIEYPLPQGALRVQWNGGKLQVDLPDGVTCSD